MQSEDPNSCGNPFLSLQVRRGVIPTPADDWLCWSRSGPMRKPRNAKGDAVGAISQKVGGAKKNFWPRPFVGGSSRDHAPLWAGLRNRHAPLVGGAQEDHAPLWAELAKTTPPMWAGLAGGHAPCGRSLPETTPLVGGVYENHAPLWAGPN